MKTTLFSMIGVTCLTAILSTALVQPASAQPETESITFGVRVPYIGTNFSELDEVIGLETNGIFLGKWFAGSTANMPFPPGAGQFCEDIDVGGTTWVGVSDAKIINKGGPIDATIFSDSFFPPDRYMLLEQDFTAVRACWLNESGGFVYVQADSSGAEYAFFIVTGEFRANN